MQLHARNIELTLDELAAEHSREQQRDLPIMPSPSMGRRAELSLGDGESAPLTANALSSWLPPSEPRRQQTGKWVSSSVHNFFGQPHGRRCSARLWRQAAAAGLISRYPLIPHGERVRTFGPYPDPCPRMRTRRAFRLFLDALSFQGVRHHQQHAASHTTLGLRCDVSVTEGAKIAGNDLYGADAETVVFEQRSSTATTIKQDSLRCAEVSGPLPSPKIEGDCLKFGFKVDSVEFPTEFDLEPAASSSDWSGYTGEADSALSVTTGTSDFASEGEQEFAPPATFGGDGHERTAAALSHDPFY